MSSFRILLLCMCLMAVIVTAGCLENPSDSSVSPSSASATPSPTIQPTAIPGHFGHHKSKHWNKSHTHRGIHFGFVRNRRYLCRGVHSWF